MLPSFQKFSKKIYYGWVIVFLCAFITLILAGARFSFGVYFYPITDEFNFTRTTTSSIQSLYMVMCFFFTFIGGWALDKYGSRVVFFLMALFTGLSFVMTSFVGSMIHIYFSYSLLLAIGTGASYPVINATISKWFDKKRGIALGLATSGIRSGQAVFAPLSALLISNFGWRYAYLITGVIVLLIVIPFSRLMKNDPRDIGALPDGYQVNPANSINTDKKYKAELNGLSLSQALRRPNFWYLMPTYLFMGFATMMLYTHIIPYAIDMNISPVQASTILTIIGVIAIPSGILIGRIIDFTGSKVPLILASLLMAGATLSLIWIKELLNFYMIAAIIGICIACIGITVASLTVDAFGKRNIGIIIASLDSTHAIGSAIGPMIGGLIYDVYGSYDLAFIIAAIGIVLSVLLFILFKPESNFTAKPVISRPN